MSRWGLLFCLILCLLIFDDFRPIQHSKVKVKISFWKSADTANLNRITIYRGYHTMRKDPLSLRHPMAEGRNASVVKGGETGCAKQTIRY